MMKRILFILCLSLFGISVFGQAPVNQPKLKPGIYLPDGSKLDEYKKTFEIKDVPNPDAETLANIDATKYWQFFQDSTRVEVVEAVTGLTLILYSRVETETKFNVSETMIVLPDDYPGSANKIVE